MIRCKPGSTDWKLITEMTTKTFKPGISQSVVLDAIEALKEAGKLDAACLNLLVDWLRELPYLTEDAKVRVEALTT